VEKKEKMMMMMMMMTSPKSCQNQIFFWDPSKQHPNTTGFGWIF